MRGGDRMSPLRHNYGRYYEHALRPFVGREDVTLVELGILTGIGLAVWTDLFPHGRIIGLDIDLSHFAQNPR